MTKRLCKGQSKSLPSPTNLPHPLKKGTLKGLVISYSLKGRVLWDAVFWFFIDSIYRYPYKALWYLIDSPYPPPPSICSQFSLALLLTLLEMADSPTVPPGNHVIPPPPWKNFFYPTPLAIKMTLPLVSLIIQKLSPKLLNFLNDLLLLTLPLPTI